MKYIDLSQIDVNHPIFKKWSLDAKKKLAVLRAQPNHEARAAYLKTHGIWSDLKPVLEKICGKKCWYSECHMHGDFEDVDHFRPKNRSLDVNGNVILEDGYWWLAYDYMNYRLSCRICNEGGGKEDYFPIKPGSQPASGESTAEEIPLLLDPCNKHDTELIGYNERGCVIPLTNDPWEIERVIQSRKRFRLGEFNDARREIQCKCNTRLKIFEMLYEIDVRLTLDTIVLMRELTSDYAPYSSVAKQYIAYQIEGKPYAKDLRKALNIPDPPDVEVDYEPTKAAEVAVV